TVRLAPRRFCEIFRQVLAGLSYSSAENIVHRDLKPDNIMICRNADGEQQVKIIDFGVAKFEQTGSEALTKSAALIGTPDYMSPEVCKGGAVDLRSDIYSLCCIMYECLMGTTPFKGATPAETMYNQLNSNTTRMELTATTLSARALGKLIDAGLSKDPQ